MMLGFLFPLSHASLKFGESSGLHSIGSPQAKVCICLALVWILNLILLSQGVRLIEKVRNLFFFAKAPPLADLPLQICISSFLMPICIMIILFLQTFSLKGSAKGITAFLYPDMSHLLSRHTWTTAIIHGISSLELFTNVLSGLASYNK